MTGLPPTFRMAPGMSDATAPIGSEDELLLFFEAGAKPREELRLGVEYERVPLLRDGSAAPYSGPDACVRAVLEHLCRTHALAPIELDGHLVGLKGDGLEVHLEPGAQVELVLAPMRSARLVAAALATWREWLGDAAEATGVVVAALGLQPITPVGSIGWIPKARYAIMKRHLGARGRLAHHMMKATAAYQLNLDYTSEADATDLVRTALTVAPLVNALALNSPLEAGRRSGWLSMRPEIWRQTDPERCGLLPFAFEDEALFRPYLDWALSVPVMFLHRDGAWHEVGDRTFRELLENGHETHGPARHVDFHLHLTTLFPEVRLKQHVEIRGADSCPTALVAALTALWRGVLYERTARGRARELVAGLSSRQREELHFDVARSGFEARLPGGPVLEAVKELLAAGRQGLDRIAAAEGEESDAPLLAPLDELAAEARTGAERLLAAWERRGRQAVVDLA